MHTPRSAFAALVAALVFLAPAAIRADADHEELTHRAIRISTRLHPENLAIQADEALIWVNYGRHIARVSFDQAVAQNLKCAGRATFTLDGSRLVSREIQAQQFVSLCKLAPGTYGYRVVLYSGPGAAPPGPNRTLEGTITVTAITVTE